MSPHSFLKKYISLFKSEPLYPMSFAAFLFLVGTLFVIHNFYQNRYFSELRKYIQTSHQIERAYIEKLPIYADYITPQKEKKLRTYLLAYHIKAARSRQAKALRNDQEIEDKISKNELSAIDGEFENISFFYNVRKKYRYLSPYSKKILWSLGQRFQKLLLEKGLGPQVKFAISSALRPVDYQKSLGKRNANATLVSSHSYGESFDIFFDEFYVVLDTVFSNSKDAKSMFGRKLRWRLGFLMGQALRRQFRSVLTEAILQLQEEGKLYAVLERRQRCYHITAR